MPGRCELPCVTDSVDAVAPSNSVWHVFASLDSGIFCCYDAKLLVGAVVYNQSGHGDGPRPSGGAVTIGMLSVLPSHQRRGIARAL